jgi:hypothetical protein
MKRRKTKMTTDIYLRFVFATDNDCAILDDLRAALPDNLRHLRYERITIADDHEPLTGEDIIFDYDTLISHDTAFEKRSPLLDLGKKKS